LTWLWHIPAPEKLIFFLLWTALQTSPLSLQGRCCAIVVWSKWTYVRVVISVSRLPSNIVSWFATLQLVFGMILTLLTYLSSKGMILMFGCYETYRSIAVPPIEISLLLLADASRIYFSRYFFVLLFCFFSPIVPKRNYV